MLGLGVSALVTEPADDVVLRSSSPVLSVPYLELQLSRPFWLGRLGVAPGLGVRLFGDLPFYVDHLIDRLGKPSLVICLDSGCGNQPFREWYGPHVGMTAADPALPYTPPSRGRVEGARGYIAPAAELEKFRELEKK